MAFFVASIVFAACGSSSQLPGAGGQASADGGEADGSSDEGSTVLDAPGEAPPDDDAPGPAPSFTRTVPGWPGRSYDIYIPGTYEGLSPSPVILALHGGGGNRAAQRKLECPGGNLADPGCLDAYATSRSFIVVYPDGTGAPLLPNVRTWNSGGGSAGWQCVSGYACNQGIDDVAYVAALLADLKTAFVIDERRVYATGISNGAAMAHRLACQLPGGIAAIAPVAGENQFATTEPCARAVPVLDVHGTADPCWPYEGGTMSCLDTNPGAKVGVGASIDGWRQRDGCNSIPKDQDLPDLANDGTTTTRHDYTCTGADVILYEVKGGGHTWPGGHPYSTTVGPTSSDFAASTVIVDFFVSHL